MNKKIAKLIEKATTVIYSGPGEIEEFDKEKFAELLVRECAAVVFKNTGPKSALNVLEHFGVEE